MYYLRFSYQKNESLLLKVTPFNKPPVSNSPPPPPPLSIKPPGVKPILLNKPPGAYSIIYGIYALGSVIYLIIDANDGFVFTNT